MATPETTFEDAILIVASVRAALINRTKHYSSDGRLLKNEKEIIAELLSQKEITFDTTEAVRVTTEEEQVDIAKRQFSGLKEKYVA